MGYCCLVNPLGDAEMEGLLHIHLANVEVLKVSGRLCFAKVLWVSF